MNHKNKLIAVLFLTIVGCNKTTPPDAPTITDFLTLNDQAFCEAGVVCCPEGQLTGPAFGGLSAGNDVAACVKSLQSNSSRQAIVQAVEAGKVTYNREAANRALELAQSWKQCDQTVDASAFLQAFDNTFEGLLGENEPCLAVQNGGCKPELFCQEGTCRQRSKLNQSCSNTLCESGLYCSSNQCLTLGAVRNDGTCADSYECASRRCDQGKCQPAHPVSYYCSTPAK